MHSLHAVGAMMLTLVAACAQSHDDSPGRGGEGRTASARGALDSTLRSDTPSPSGLDAASGGFDSRRRGLSTAALTVYEVSDFQCPYCRQFATTTYERIETAYVQSGRIHWVFVNAPKPQSHPNALRAAEVAMCAAAQARFWPVHDALFARQEDWSYLPDPDAYFRALWDSLGLDAQRMQVCLTSGDGARQVAADVRYVTELGIGGVPAFVIDNRMVIQGAMPYARFVAVLDSALAEVHAGRRDSSTAISPQSRAIPGACTMHRDAAGRSC